MDFFVIEDSMLWINLELQIIKKNNIFKPQNLIRILTHFSRQHEGTNDLYDQIEHGYMSGKFQDLKLSQKITLGYNYYQVHTGSKAFFSKFAEEIYQNISENVSTYDLLRILQIYSEISKDFVKMFVLIEEMLISRFEQLSKDEICVAVCAFAMSGYGTPYLYKVFEAALKSETSNLTVQQTKEVARGFIFSLKGSKQFL